MKILYIISIFFLLGGCQAIEKKSQETIKNENEKLSKFLQQPESELKIVMGEPDQIIYDNKGEKIFVYAKKSLPYHNEDMQRNAFALRKQTYPNNLT